MLNQQILGLLWVLLASVASALATYLIKMSHGDSGFTATRLLWLGSAVGCYGLGFVCYSLALQRMQISLAYPIMTAITMTLVAGIGYLWLQEPLGASRLAGIALVGAGAFMLAR